MNIKITESLDDIDFNVPKELFKSLGALTVISKGLSKSNEEERKYIQGKIKELREKSKQMIFKKWRVTATSKRYFKYMEYDHFPTREDIKHVRKTLIDSIKFKRAELKKKVYERKEILGFIYSTAGGVFEKAGSIKALTTQTDPVARIQRTKKPHDKMKANYIGVELEFISTCDGKTLETLFIKAGLAGFVQVKRDGSIKVEEMGQHQHEVTILCRQDSVKEILSSVCSVLNSAKVAALVNNSCGLHVHVDARNKDAAVMYSNFVSCLPMLANMIPKCRTTGPHANQYCAMNVTKDFMSKENTSSNGRRYQAVNPDAYGRYKTIELRLHSGSTNAVKIINWVSILSIIGDCDRVLSKDIKTAEEFGVEFPMAQTKLLNYIVKRTETFNKESPMKADTRGDHFWLNEYELAI